MLVTIHLKGGGTISGPHEVYNTREMFATALAQEKTESINVSGTAEEWSKLLMGWDIAAEKLELDLKKNEKRS